MQSRSVPQTHNWWGGSKCVVEVGDKKRTARLRAGKCPEMQSPERVGASTKSGRARMGQISPQM